MKTSSRIRGRVIYSRSRAVRENEIQRRRKCRKPLTTDPTRKCDLPERSTSRVRARRHVGRAYVLSEVWRPHTNRTPYSGRIL